MIPMLVFAALFALIFTWPKLFSKKDYFYDGVKYDGKKQNLDARALFVILFLVFIVIIIMGNNSHG